MLYEGDSKTNHGQPILMDKHTIEGLGYVV